MRRLIGVSTSPLVGSIYNMGMWDKVAAAWVNVATRRTLEREEAARRRYKETRRSLENGGCIGNHTLWLTGAWFSYASSIVAWP